MADRTVAYRIVADIGSLRAQMAQAGASVQKFGNDVTAVSKDGEKFRKGLDDAGRAAGRFGLVAAVGLGAAVLKAANFDQAMSNVAAATHESAENMELLRAAALKAGADTVFSATEAASAVEELSKAGLSTAEVLGGGLQGALNLATAGAIDVTEAAETAAQAMAQFGLSGQAVPHIADLLAAGAGKASGSVHDLGMALNQTGVVASQVGLSIEETTGALSAFAFNGLKGSDAGTSFKTMLLALNPTTKKASEAMDALGLHAFDNQGKFIGLAQYAENLQSSLRDMSEEQRNSTLKIIFGNDAIRAANILYAEGGRGVAEWTDKVNDSGFAAETAAIRLDNLKGDLEQLSGSFETALIGTGTSSQGPLRSLVQQLTDVVNAYNGLSQGAKTGVGAVLGFTAVAGGSLFVISKVVRAVSDTHDALSNLGPAGKTAGRGIAVATKGLAALTVGLLAYNAAKEKFDIGVSESENAQSNTLLDTRAGPVLADQIRATTAAIKEAQKQADEGFGVNVGFAKIFPFSQSAADAQDRVDSLQKHLKDLEGQQELNAAAAEQATTATDDYTSSHARLRTVVTFSAEAIKKASDALKDSEDAARGAAEGFFGLGEKVDDSKVSLREWIADLQKQADALADFRKNAQEAGDKGLRGGLIAALKEAGPAGALRLKQLASATPEVIAQANKAWKAGSDQVAGYVKDATRAERESFDAMVRANMKASVTYVDVAQRAFDRFPKTVNTQIKLDNRQAVAGLRLVKAALAELRDKTITLRTIHQETRLGPTHFATGGSVRGPGSGTSDSIPAYLSNGEYVIKSAAVARYGVAMFDRLNAMHFAQGGPVGGGSSSGIDYDTLGRVIASYTRGDTINVTAQDMRDIDRQLAERRARSSSDGIRR